VTPKQNGNAHGKNLEAPKVLLAGRKGTSRLPEYPSTSRHIERKGVTPVSGGLTLLGFHQDSGAPDYYTALWRHEGKVQKETGGVGEERNRNLNVDTTAGSVRRGSAEDI